MAAVKSFELAPAGTAANVFFIASAVLPGLVLAGLWAWNPAELNGLPVWLAALIVLLGPVLLAAMGLLARNPRIELDAGGLTLRLGLIRRHWPRAGLQTQTARMIDLDTAPEWRPKWKLFGAALPGLQAGLFRLHNGQNARIYLTGRRALVVVPIQRGPILLSLVRPRDFLAALQSA